MLLDVSCASLLPDLSTGCSEYQFEDSLKDFVREEILEEILSKKAVVMFFMFHPPSFLASLGTSLYSIILIRNHSTETAMPLLSIYTYISIIYVIGGDVYGFQMPLLVKVTWTFFTLPFMCKDFPLAVPNLQFFMGICRVTMPMMQNLTESNEPERRLRL